MTEFTAEFIAEQREILLHVRRGLSVEEGDRNHHTHIVKKFSKGEHQIVDKITVADVHGFNSGHGKQIAEAIMECCNNYPEALDHIERQAQRIKWLEHFLEEAAHAAACGKNPIDYLATEVPTDLRDEIERQAQRIAELEQERRWISVEEKFPEESGYYLIAWQSTWGKGELFTIQEFYKKEDEFGFGRVNVKYWKPLPQPPKDV